MSLLGPAIPQPVTDKSDLSIVFAVLTNRAGKVECNHHQFLQSHKQCCLSTVAVGSASHVPSQAAFVYAICCAESLALGMISRQSNPCSLSFEVARKSSFYSLKSRNYKLEFVVV